MAQEGDIVFMIGADVAGLTRAGQSGEKSLAAMEKAAKDLERQIGKIGESGVAFQREMNRLTGVTKEVENSARDSAAAFEAFDRSRQQVDNLRASIDPLFAAQKRYEQALQTLDAALEQGTVSAREHAAMTDQLAAAYLRADTAAEAMGGGIGMLGGLSSTTQGKLQQVGFQVQDFAVQVGAGTSATQAFAQQFPQLAMAFGPVGAAVGTLAAVGIPVLMAAFGSAGESAKTFRDALSEVDSALNALRETTAIYSLEGLTGLAEKYGEVNLALMEHIELQRQMDLRTAIVAAQEAAAALRTEMEGWINPLAGLQEIFPDIAGKVNLMYNSLQDIEAANTFQEQVDALTSLRDQILQATGGIENMTAEQFAFYAKVQDSLDAVIQLNAEGSKAQGWLAAATAAADKWAAALWKAAAGAAAARNASVAGPVAGGLARAGDDGRGGQRDTVAGSRTNMPDQPWLNTGGGGGGGGGQNPVEAQLEQLRQQLMTEEQLEMESFAKRQEMLQQALEQRLLTQQEYATLMEEAQQNHANRMSEIDVWRYGTGLDKAEAFFGGMASALQGGNEKMLAISKKFAAAEALINAWKGFSDVLADKTLPFWAKIPSAMKVLAAGMGAVNAIKGGGGGGGGRATSVASTSATQQAPAQTLNLTIRNDPFGYGERIARSIADQMNAARRSGSSIIATVSST